MKLLGEGDLVTVQDGEGPRSRYRCIMSGGTKVTERIVGKRAKEERKSDSLER